MLFIPDTPQIDNLHIVKGKTRMILTKHRNLIKGVVLAADALFASEIHAGE